MSPELFLRLAIEPALTLLPVKFDSPGARAMLLSIALQESGLRHRAQIGGPAKSYYQFEVAGVQGVLDSDHDGMVKAALVTLGYPHDYGASEIHAAIEHNDILATVFARRLLWSVPEALPGQFDGQAAWGQYLSAWRPGKPRIESWNGNFIEAWSAVA